MNKIWKDIENYENYQISNYGRIKSKNYKRQGYEKILKQNINGRGYYYVLLSKKNKYKNLLIHREVAKAFIDNKNNYTDINHKDGNKLNNNVDNLEWCSRSYNLKHAFKNGLKKGSMGMAYKKRCQLAIEYIEKNWIEYSDFQYVDNDDELDIDCESIKELIDILKGKDE